MYHVIIIIETNPDQTVRYAAAAVTVTFETRAIHLYYIIITIISFMKVHVFA